MVAEGSNQPPPGSGPNPSPTEEAIRQQLEKILTSPQFVNSPNLRNFLRFIVEKTLAGQAEEIKGYTVATQVLGRKADFDPNLDPIVRILAGRLRRALERYYASQGKAMRWSSISQGRLRAHVSQVSGGGAALSFRGSPEPVLALPSGPAVAVMPLLNLTGDRKQEYFADGLAEELTSELARYQDLRVIAYQSTLHWKGKKMTPGSGPDLRVRFLVKGSVRKAARTVRLLST